MPGRQSPSVVAARLLSWLRERTPLDEGMATPVEELAARLGVIIETFDPGLIPDTLGYLEPGEPLIFLRAGLAESVRRFTLAHELGHAALHRRYGLAAEISAAGEDWPDELALPGCADSDLDTLTSDDDESLHPGQAYSVRARREGEANAFAAALLLPPAATRAAYEALCARNVERPALALAQRFGVSEEVALRRLAALLTETDDAEQEVAPSLPTRLDADQRRAAHARTPALVMAGPGSGKTSALLARIAYLIDERGVAPERILALTFSRKAARELSDRVARMTPNANASPRVSTIHAFCGDTLRYYGPLVGLRSDFRLMTEVEGYFLLRGIVNRAPLIHYTPLTGPTMYFKDLLSAISRAKDDLTTPDECLAAAEQMTREATTPESRANAERAQELASLYAAYQATLEQRGDVDYGDLVAKMARLLREAPDASADIRGRYDHILVDEFQDINHAMGVVLRELAGRRGALWAVGDVDQAIYRFRGAAPANMRRFPLDFDGARVISLARNYRSHPQILHAASAFASAFLPNEQRAPLRPTRGKAKGRPAVYLATAPDSAAELDGLAQMMRERAAAGTPLRQQVALLRTREHVRQVCVGLRERGIPAQVATPLFDQPLIKSLLAIVSLTVDPLAIGLLRAGDQPDHAFSNDDALTVLRLARERRVAPLDALHGREAQAALSHAGVAGLRRLERIVADLRAAPSVTVGLSRYTFSLTTLGRRLLSESAHAEAAQVARLLDICRTFDDQRAAGALLGIGEDAPHQADWSGLLDYIGALRQLGAETKSPELAPTQDAALVMTAHAAKGLEFPIVYLPQLATTRFPLSHRSPDIRLPATAQPNEGADDDANDEENLFYVSLTRARDILVLSHARRYGKVSRRPSAYLAPIEKALGDELARLQWDGDPAARLPLVQADDEEGQAVATVAPDGASRVVALSQLEAYLRCPQQYAYQYVYGLQPPLAMSVSLHAAYKAISGKLWERFASDTPPSLDEALSIFNEQWSAARSDARSDALRRDDGAAPDAHAEALSEVYLLHGKRAIERFWRALRDSATPDGVIGDEIIALHEGAPGVVSVPLAGATITGTLDHVELAAVNSDSPQPASRVARFKSGKAGGDTDVRDLFYVLAAEEMSQDGRAVEAVHMSLTSGSLERLDIKDQKRRNLERAASAALDGLARESYPPQPESHKCATCPFALVCPA